MRFSDSGGGSTFRDRRSASRPRGGSMKFLLTSAGISNASIHDALVNLLGKPIAESSALYIPTAIYANPNGASLSSRVIRGEIGDPFCDAGWKSLGLLE